MGKDINNFVVIGLCGGSGAGKSIVGEIFKANGIPVIDTDSVYHDITASAGECVTELSDAFGAEIVNANGGLDRAKLGEIVFANDASGEKLKKLNEIAHRHILSRADEILADYEQAGYKAAAVDAPVLFESGYDKKCDVTVCVIADTETRIERIVSRDNITREKAEVRISKQKDDKFLLANCDFAVYNNSDADSLSEQVMKIIGEILVPGAT
jgi:dephospho-CoA kinase